MYLFYQLKINNLDTSLNLSAMKSPFIRHNKPSLGVKFVKVTEPFNRGIQNHSYWVVACVLLSEA